MSPQRHVVTVPAGLPHGVQDSMLTAIEKALGRAGASRIWVDLDVHRDIAVMAEFSPVEEMVT